MLHETYTTRPHNWIRRRRGATAVEFAIAAPIVFLFVFAGIEFARAYSIRQSIDNALYEATRRAIVPGATEQSVRATALAVMKASSVEHVTVKVSSTARDATVSIEVPYDKESWIAPFYLKKVSLQNSLTLAKESSG